MVFTTQKLYVGFEVKNAKDLERFIHIEGVRKIIRKWKNNIVKGLKQDEDDDLLFYYEGSTKDGDELLRQHCCFGEENPYGRMRIGMLVRDITDDIDVDKEPLFSATKAIVKMHKLYPKKNLKFFMYHDDCANCT